MKKTILISFICSFAFLKGLGQITTITSTITSIQDTSCAGSTITLYYQFKNNATVTTTLTNVCAKIEFGVLTSPTIIGSTNSFSIIIPAGATTSLSVITGTIPATASGLNRIRIRAYTNCSAAGGGNLPNPPDFIYIINTPGTPNITSNGTPAVCPFGTSIVQLTSSATGTVLWSNGQTTPTITVNTSGSYTVSETNQCGTSISAPYIVYQRHLPTVNILSTPTTGCDSVTLYSSGTYYNSLSWSSGQLDSTATFTNSGQYYAIATNTCGAVNSNTVSVTINPSPTVTVTKNSLIKCAGQIDTLIASGANSYNWTIGGNTNTISINPTSQSVYNVSGTDLNGCSGLGSFTVLVNPLPALTIATTNTLLCVGQTATLSANGASTYTWSTSETINSISVSPTVSTTYTLTGNSNLGCSNAITFTQNVSLCTGIENLENNQNFSIYPNPTKSTLFINSDFDLDKVEIVNCFGTSVKKLNINGSGQIDISELSSGIYFLKVFELNSENCKVFKIIKER